MYQVSNSLRNEIQEIFKNSIIVGGQETDINTASMHYPIINKITGKELSINIPFMGDGYYLAKLDNGKTIVESFKEHLIESIRFEIE